MECPLCEKALLPLWGLHPPYASERRTNPLDKVQREWVEKTGKRGVFSFFLSFSIVQERREALPAACRW